MMENVKDVLHFITYKMDFVSKLVHTAEPITLTKDIVQVAI